MLPMGMTVVLGFHKFSLQATIDRHGPSIYAIRKSKKTTSTVYECTKHLVYEKVIRE